MNREIGRVADLVVSHRLADIVLSGPDDLEGLFVDHSDTSLMTTTTFDISR